MVQGGLVVTSAGGIDPTSEVRRFTVKRSGCPGPSELLSAFCHHNWSKRAMAGLEHLDILRIEWRRRR